MADPVESAAMVLLVRYGGHRWQHYADLVEEAGSALAVLEHELTPLGQQSLLAPEAGADRAALDRAATEIAEWRASGLRLITVLDPEYPENLRAVHDRPPMLFVAGALEPRDARAVAVVGARQASPQGVEAANAIARQAVERGFTVVSGLAAGIDTAAHSGALASGGRTVAVIGTGLRRVYPPENAELQRLIASRYAVLSQFWPDAPPTRRSFPMRNAVMSGLTLATVVVEASETSGSRLQGRLALAQGRPVLLHRSLLHQAWARQFATRPGAHVFSSAAEAIAVVERLSAPDALTA
jgi:DNA processing protein